MPEKPPDLPGTTEAERFAITKISKEGPRFAHDYPAIVDDARNGLSLLDIAKKHGVADLYGVTLEIAHNIVKRALQELLSKEERAAIYGPRLQQTRRETGHRTKQEGIGVFGRSPEKRRADSHASGSIGGPRTQEMGVGIFGMTQEQRQAASRKGAEAKGDGWFGGKKVDDMDEGSYALFLSKQEAYLNPPGHRFAGSIDYTKVMNTINGLFGNNRSRAATKGFFENQKKEKNILPME